jgi:hypothetical protein
MGAAAANAAPMIPAIADLGSAAGTGGKLTNFLNMMGTGMRLGQMAGLGGGEQPQRTPQQAAPQGPGQMQPPQPQAPIPTPAYNAPAPQPTAVSLMNLFQNRRGF